MAVVLTMIPDIRRKPIVRSIIIAYVPLTITIKDTILIAWVAAPLNPGYPPIAIVIKAYFVSKIGAQVIHPIIAAASVCSVTVQPVPPCLSTAGG